eukprot:4531510-Pyramimonas_sp.AAC.1
MDSLAADPWQATRERKARSKPRNKAERVLAATSHRLEKSGGQYIGSVYEQLVPAGHIILFAASQCPGPRERERESRVESVSAGRRKAGPDRHEGQPCFTHLDVLARLYFDFLPSRWMHGHCRWSM